MTADDHCFRCEDRAVHSQRIAGHIAAHPEDLAIALTNYDRWRSLGRAHPAPMREWQRLIHAAQISPEALHDFVRSFLGRFRATTLGRGRAKIRYEEVYSPPRRQVRQAKRMENRDVEARKRIYVTLIRSFLGELGVLAVQILPDHAGWLK